MELFLLLLSTGYILLFAVLAFIRMSYPFELEWIEGAIIDEIRWILAGNALYGEPSLSFIPFDYTPFYFYLSAVLMKILGVGFVAPRLVSVLSTLGCFLLLFKIVDAQTRYPPAGIVAAGIYAASYRFAGAWMDIAKTDSLFLFLTLAAFLIGERYRNRWGLIGSGFLFVLAYYTKQNVLPLVVVLASVSLIASRGRTLLQWLTVAVVGFLSYWVLNTVSSGWFYFYTLDVVNYYWSPGEAVPFWRSFVQTLWPALLTSLAGFAFIMKSDDAIPVAGKSEHLWNYLGLAGGLLAASASVSIQFWTYGNGYMPACLGVALLAGLGFGQIIKLREGPSRRAISSWVKGGVLVLLTIQFALLFYKPFDQLPSAKDREAGEQFSSRLRNLPGEVFVFNHGFVSYLAGKRTFFHSTAYGDATAGSMPPSSDDSRQRREMVRQVYRQAISGQVFDWVIVDDPSANWLPYYLHADKIFDDPQVFYPLTGARARPESLMIKNPVARGGEFPLTDPAFNTFLSSEWGDPENWGRWAIGTESVVQIVLEQEHAYRIIVGAFPFCYGQSAKQVMTIEWNQQRLGDATFTSCEPRLLEFDLPAALIDKGLNNLRFKFDKAVSPAEVGLSGDERHLAVGFTLLRFIQQGQ